MNDKTYNGWTNYATWRVNLEMFDGTHPTIDFGCDINSDDATYDLAKCLQEYAENIITDYKSETNLAQDYALAFLSYVNWREIAHSLLINHFSEENLPIPEKVWEA
jgi:hypothetical protein